MPDFTPDPGAEWTGRVGSAWAEQWRRTDRSFGALTGRLLEADAIGTFHHALDIGCGAGELVRRLGDAVSGQQCVGHEPAHATLSGGACRAAAASQ